MIFGQKAGVSWFKTQFLAVLGSILSLFDEFQHKNVYQRFGRLRTALKLPTGSRRDHATGEHGVTWLKF